MGLIPLNYFVHLANFIAMACDGLLISPAPFPARYLASAFFVYAGIYTLFTITYYKTGGLNELDQPWVYTVLYWAQASSTGFLIGVIDFLIVPAVGLCCYAAVFTRRRGFGKESFPWSRPACFPVSPPLLLLPRFKHRPNAAASLPIVATVLLAGALGGSTGVGLEPSNSGRVGGYWTYRHDQAGAVVPFISDMAVDHPGYYIFAVLLTAGGGVLVAVFRLLYEAMDGALAEEDGAEGVFVYPPLTSVDCGVDREKDQAMLAPAPCDPPAAPPPRPSPKLYAHPTSPALSLLLCCVTRPKPRHCCFCCWQGLRGQAHSAYICGTLAALALPVVGWCSAGIAIEVHSLAAALFFVCAYAHICLTARIQAARLRAALSSSEKITNPSDDVTTRRLAWLRRSALLKSFVAWFVPIGGLVSIGITELASVKEAGRVWGGFLSPIIEWSYCGIAGIATASLCWELREAVAVAVAAAAGGEGGGSGM